MPVTKRQHSDVPGAKGTGTKTIGFSFRTSGLGLFSLNYLTGVSSNNQKSNRT